MALHLVFDLETHLIELGNIIPKPVAGGVMVYNGKEFVGPLLRTMDEVCADLREAISRKWLIVGHNVFYDLACSWRHDPSLGEYIWYALENGLVSSTDVREKLIKCAEGRLDFDPYHFKGPPKFSLADLAKEYLNVDIFEDKKNPYSWRLRYRELDGVPFDQWPEEAKQYLLNDVSITGAIWRAQCADRSTKDGIQFVSGGRVTNEVEQCRAAWVLLLITAWGLITDKEAVDKLELELLTESTKYIESLKSAGLVKPTGGRNLNNIRERVQKAFEDMLLDVPRTPPSSRSPEGQVKTDGDTLIESCDPLLVSLEEYNSVQKLLDTFVRPVLRQGTQGTIHPNYDVLKATGRTSSYGTGRGNDKEGCNIQQLPRKGGVRECFIPRPGYVYIDCDYSTIELAALAQVTYSMFGYSAMREYLIKGYDLHLVMAAGLLNADYATVKQAYEEDDERVKDMRQLAKVPNFGFPGGMGPEKLCLFARQSYGMDIKLETAQSLRAVWLQTFPEMVNYFNYFSQVTNNPNGEFTLVQPGSRRVRGKAHYTSGANSMFQGLAADGAKNALWLLSREMYLDRNSALYGSRLVAFIHDECLAEAPEEAAPYAAERLSQLMVTGMKAYLPDVPVEAEPVLMRRWYKGAKQVRDARGQLVCWEPKQRG
jgi:DNA polymerase I-like protein with 3'-5' exonuclease and polymerase domains